MAQTRGKYPDRDKFVNPVQIGGIETSVLDNGPGKGTRIAWVNTGGGLRYKVVIDRAMDIADAFYNQYSLAWLSHVGVIGPRPDAKEGIEWLYTFGGGLLATCGLSHMGGPESDENEQRGLHGRVGNLPATIESVIQGDPGTAKNQMSITGTIKQSRLFGTKLECKRTISSPLGEPIIRIRDVVTNRGGEPVPHMLLYHCNYGYPLVDEGTDILYKGKWVSRGLAMDDAIFNSKHNFRKCCGLRESHCRGEEACSFIDVTPDKNGICTAGLYNRRLSLALTMKFKKKQLPWLTNWQHWGRGEYVTALEPGTNPPIGQNKARQQKKLIYIAPGKSKTYELEIAVLTDSAAINKLIKQ